MSTLPVDHAFVINLDRRPEKWLRTQKLLTDVGITAERVTAVDGGNVREAAATACKLSHIRALVRAETAGYKRIIIFEDDVLPAKNLQLDLLSQRDWRVVYLGATQVKWDGIQFEEACYRPHKTLGTWALAVDHRYFARLIDAYANSLKTADLTLQDVLQDDPYAFVLYPNQFITDISISDIRAWPSPQHLVDLCRWDLSRYNGTELLITDAAQERIPWSSHTKVPAAPQV